MCGTPGGHKGAQTPIGQSQSPSSALETARPVGRASAWGEGFGNRSPDPLYDGWAEIIPLRYLPVVLGERGMF